MANGYVPHFMRPNPMFPGIPPAHPPPHQATRPKHPTPFSPPNYAHLPPGHQHQHHAGAHPAPIPGLQPHPFHPSDPSNLFHTGAREQTCRFPNAFPADGRPNIFQRFWIALFGPPIRLLISIYHALRQTYTFFTTPDITTILHMFFTDLSIIISLTLENSWSLLVGLLVVVALCVGAWFLSPKGENQLVWRSTLILSATSCYIMWAITFLAQWHPLIEPKMAKLRNGYVGGS